MSTLWKGSGNCFCQIIWHILLIKLVIHLQMLCVVLDCQESGYPIIIAALAQPIAYVETTLHLRRDLP